MQEQTCGYHINLAAHLPLTQALFTQTPLGLGGAKPLICENVGNAAGVADARGLLANAGRLGALLAGIAGLMLSYYIGSSTGASITLVLALFFAVTFCFRKKRL